MNTPIEILNRFGGNALHFAWPMLWQSSLLIAVLFTIDFALRRRVRAAVRYALWLVLLAKLLLPPSLALPTSAAWWLFPSAASRKLPTTRFVVSYGPDTAPRLPLLTAPVFTPPRSTLSATTWIIPVWITLSFGLLVWMTARWRQVARDVKRAAPAPAWLNELFAAAKSSIGLRRAVRLRVTDQAMSPAVCGLFRPVILLPQSLVEKLSPAQLRAVLLHELTHLRRGDVWANCVQALIQVVYWWHPLVWLANARIRRVREEAVDDAVMLTLRDDAETYAPTLLEVAKLAFHRPLASLGLVGILESRSALRQRIERLINFRAPRKAGLTFVSLCGICFFSAAALPMGEAPPYSSDASKNATQPVFSGITNKPASIAGVSTNLDTRTFIVTPDTGLANLRKKTGLTESSTPDEYLRGFSKLLATSGATLPPTSIWLKENGLLLVRGRPQELDAVEQTVSELNGFPARETRGGANSGTTIDNASSTAAENGNPASLSTRTFKVDPNTFYSGLQSLGAQNFVSADSSGGDHHDGGGLAFVTNQTANISLAAKQFFTTLGLNLDPPKSVFFNDRLGVLFVRATEQDMDTVEKAVQVLNFKPPQQIHIKARFIEAPEETVKNLGANLTPAGVTNVAGVLTGPDLQPVLHTLEQSKETETLAEPEVTTLSGRQTQMRATQIITVITNFTYRETSTNSAITPQTTQVECGPVLDAIASVMPDGYTIDLRIIPSLTEFLGYDKPTNTIPTVTSTGAIVDVPTIRPSFYVRQTDAHLKLWDGQTVVLGGLISTQVQTTKDTVPVSGGRAAETPQFRTQTTHTVKKHELLVLITVTLVDAAGNRIHSDDEMLIARPGIPPQDFH
jgi:beta-lactamase regulating signal transducer with metallopeptidase domain/type II secretory pathway component GspD/PulD (secretin)